MNCIWCSVGISQSEKYCSQCGGPNARYIDIRPEVLPVTNIGNKVLEYPVEVRPDEWRWHIPPHGILKRIIILPEKVLKRVQITINAQYVLFDIQPQKQEVIYTSYGNVHMDLNQVTEIRLWSKVFQKVKIIIETDEE